MTETVTDAVLFARERAHDLWQEAMPLFESHHREVSHYQDILLNVDVGAYCAMEDAGALRCYTARLRGELIGYCVYFVRRSIRYQDSLQANMDAIYVRPEERRGSVGTKLLLYAEGALRCDGVQVVYQHWMAKDVLASLVLAGLGRLMRRLGYDLVDVIVAKRLDRKEVA